MNHVRDIQGLDTVKRSSSRRTHVVATIKPLTVAMAALCSAHAVSAEAADAEPILRAVEVVGTTPLPGIDQPRERVPSNVQTINAAALRDKQSATLPDFLG